MCAIIIAASKLKVTDITGFNPLYVDATYVNSDDMKKLEEEIASTKDEHIKGVVQMFPFGPTYTFNGVEVPTFITCSKNGSITSQLLDNMLQIMDKLCLFDRSEGTTHCLLCDGHGSRFEEPFLKYTLESSTPRGCCIGVPYGTSLWQVGDSEEQNGTFKVERKKSKADTARENIRSGIPTTLERSDIVQIVHVAWKKLFACVNTNKRAIAAGDPSATFYWIILNFKRQITE
jgi:hypothetical protein